MGKSNAVLSDLIALGGVGADITELSDTIRPPSPTSVSPIRIGVHRRPAMLPESILGHFDILLSDLPNTSAPWTAVPNLDDSLNDLLSAITANPIASSIAAQVLRLGSSLSFDQALVLESLAYSLLLSSEEFRSWRTTTPKKEMPGDEASRVVLSREGSQLEVRLNRAHVRNAFDARMRDQLCEALSSALEDGDITNVSIRGEGPCFSSGGDLNEFGTTSDAGVAHLIRILRSPVSLLHALGPRATAYVHGSCYGAGIEVPAAAGRVISQDSAVFCLPEVSMGLIPGAGGTASISRRIGRQRMCYMALSGKPLDCHTALRWGLVDAIEAA